MNARTSARSDGRSRSADGRRRSLERAALVDVDVFPVEGFTNGANVQHREVLLRLRQLGVEVRVLTVSCSRYSPRGSIVPADRGYRIDYILQGLGVCEYLVPRPSEEGGAEDYRRTIAHALADFGPDLVLLNTPPNRLSEAEVILAEEVARRNAVIVCFIPDDHFPRLQEASEPLSMRYGRAIGGFRLMSPSAFIAGRARKGLRHDVDILPNLFSPQPMHGRTGRRDCITLINPHPLKGIQIFEGVARRMPQQKFLVVRGWPYPPTYETRLGNVEVISFQPDLRDVWSRTRLLLVPSLCREGFGRVVVEAMSNGIPVIAHRIGALPEAAGDAAILIEPPPFGGTVEQPEIAPAHLAGAIDRYRKAIDELLSSDARWHLLSRRSRESARRTIEAAEERIQGFLSNYSLPLRTRPTRTGVVILSPHSDDAAFSLGGALRARIFGSGVTIFTIFGRSNYSIDRGFTEDVEEVSNTRRAEDEAYARRLGVKLRYAMLPEASLRLGSSFEVVFSDGAEDDLPLGEEAWDELVSGLEELRPGAVLAPLGLGGHRDHLAVLELARQICAQAGLPIGFYEDLPYAAAFPPWPPEIFRFVDRSEPRLHPFHLPLGDHLEEKLEDLQIYSSQVNEEVLRDVALHAQRLEAHRAVERIWVGRSAEALFRCSGV